MSSSDLEKSRERLAEYERIEHGLGAAIGSRLRQARLDAGMSQEGLGEALGYGPGMVSAIENGRRRMKLEDLLRASFLLDRSPEYFLDLAPASTAPKVAMALRAELAELPDKELSASVSLFLDELDMGAVQSAVPDLRGHAPEDAAQKVLDGCGIVGPAVQLEDVCAQLGIPIERRAFAQALSALLLALGDDNYLIAVNERHSSRRRRFSVAHECGHAVLRHPSTHFLELSADDVPEPETRSVRVGDEREANQFAAALLMPRDWVREDFNSGVTSVQVLARRYDVSELAMGYRLTNLGLS